MLKDILALIGAAMLSKKGYELYRSYRQLEQENTFLRNERNRRGVAEHTTPTATPQQR